MTAMTFSHVPDMGDAASSVEKLRRKFGPMAMVFALHGALFYMMYSGMLTRIVDVAVKEAVLVTFVEPPPELKPPPPAAPKVVPVTKLDPPKLPYIPPPEVQVAVQPQQNVIAAVQKEVAVEKVPAPAPAPVVSAPPAPPSSGPITITSGVQYILPPQLVYPQMSKRMGEQGKVVLRILVNEAGKPDQVIVQTSSGSARLDEAGRQAALRALFKPHMEDGRAVSVYAIVPLVFKLAS